MLLSAQRRWQEALSGGFPVFSLLWTDFFIQYVLCSTQSCQLSDLGIQGAQEGLVRTHRCGLCALSHVLQELVLHQEFPLPTNPWLLFVWSCQILFQGYISPCRSQTPTITLWNKSIKPCSFLPPSLCFTLTTLTDSWYLNPPDLSTQITSLK